jgi:hypothetical protein
VSDDLRDKFLLKLRDVQELHSDPRVLETIDGLAAEGETILVG